MLLQSLVCGHSWKSIFKEHTLTCSRFEHPLRAANNSRSSDNGRQKFANVQQNRYLGPKFFLTNLLVATFDYINFINKTGLSYTLLFWMYLKVCVATITGQAQNCDWYSPQYHQNDAKVRYRYMSFQEKSYLFAALPYTPSELQSQVSPHAFGIPI